ncbi:hypothetical protein B4110_3795 [Parageobacillus toebii]|uniref:Uncharacterized protein n=1 Tax=Parageobacillus toebii TaxID=153151 RepID=A0A150MNF1_9BACL|nr:hypothetical protein B4110_3795 [Parageobacillus toebii]
MKRTKDENAAAAALRFYLTYEELKLTGVVRLVKYKQCFYLTYEELKLVSGIVTVPTGAFLSYL